MRIRVCANHPGKGSLDSNGKLLMKLASQGIGYGLSRLDLAAWELPPTSIRLTSGTLAHQHLEMARAASLGSMDQAYSDFSEGAMINYHLDHFDFDSPVSPCYRDQVTLKIV
jgi:hypothetical protein